MRLVLSAGTTPASLLASHTGGGANGNGHRGVSAGRRLIKNDRGV